MGISKKTLEMEKIPEKEGFYEEDEYPPEDDRKPQSERRKRKKRKKKHYFLKFLIVIAAGTGLFFFMSSDYFNIDSINVKGNDNYTKEQIIQMSGIRKGDNIFLTRESKVEKKMKKDSYIASVSLSRGLPDRITVTVKERSEIAAISYGKHYILLDKKGYVLTKTDKEPELTLLEGLTITDMTKGDILQVKEKTAFSDTLSILRAMKKSDLFFKKIDISRVVVKAYIYDNLICRGRPENIIKSMKNGNLEEILYDLYKKDIKRGVVNIGSGKYCSFSPDIE